MYFFVLIYAAAVHVDMMFLPHRPKPPCQLEETAPQPEFSAAFITG
jgi:hypothetical protein